MWAWAMVAGVVACGPSVTVQVSPLSTALATGASHEFTATVRGTTDPSVTWTATCGTFSGSGNPATYVAPATPGACTVTATSVADATAFGNANVTVLGPGEVVWTHQFGTHLGDAARSLAVDGSGHILVVGDTCSSLAGPWEGADDVFVRKLDTDANVLWTRQFGTDDWDYGVVAVDGAGNVLVAGETGGSLVGENAGPRDVFVRKYDATGGVVWTRQFGTDRNDAALAVAADGAGNVVVAGLTEGSLAGATEGMTDAFVRKYDAAGNELWTRQFGTDQMDYATGVAVDGAGDIVVAGNTYGSLASANLGYADVFVRRLDAAGNEVWSHQFGSDDDDYAFGVAADAAGNALITGTTYGTLAVANLGGFDAFVRKIDAAGAEVWTRQFGTVAYDRAYGVAADASGSVLVAGYTEGTLAAGGGGEMDAFVRKLTP
jgi:hypothetical protein